MTVGHRPFATVGINRRTSAPERPTFKVCSFRLPNMGSFRLPLTPQSQRPTEIVFLAGFLRNSVHFRDSVLVCESVSFPIV